MTNSSILLSEKKNKQKGMRISIMLNATLIILALFPFLTMDNNPEPEPQRFVEIQFTDFKSSSSKSAEGTKKQKLEAEKKVEKMNEEEVKPEPKVKPAPKPKRKPVLTTPEPNPPVKTSPPAPKTETDDKKPTKVRPQRDPHPRRPKRSHRNKRKRNKPSKPGKETGKTSDTKQDGSDKPTNSGGGEAAENGKDATTGKTNTGTSVGDFPGDGLFNRRVIYRADVKSVTKEEGKIVINLCVNRAGRVVYSKFNKEASTIKTTSVIRKALEVAKQYRFEKDYSAPDKQCGKLTFIFEIEEE
ncbi:MAG TPA: hypothetical protein ENJ45_02260 [Phaeodactylibacter sp.]|nr:hypothetical protein [Phaeodactylibacter sp.]